MTSVIVRVTSLTVAIVAFHSGIALAQGKIASWLDDAKPLSWNRPGGSIPDAPTSADIANPKCRELARPPQLDEDKRLRDEGWDLVGAYQGGWQSVVIRGTAGYDGMCRPRQYQDFVFVRGLFAGTLSPQPMDSRADGALARVFLQSSSQLVAEYNRYSATDPLCCPSRTTRVVFEIANDPPIVRPASASTTDTRAGSPGAVANRPLEGSYSALVSTSWRLVKFQGSDDTTLTPDDRAKYTIEFATDGRLTARIDCNRGRGTWKSSGPNQIEFGLLALTRAKCPAGSLHDQTVKQWGNIRSYVIRDDHLFLALMADGGVYEFEPVATRR
jgi:heat shock protein HslJ